MQEEAILIGISQLGAVYAGFIAIFLVFTRKDGRFSTADSLRVRSLLFSSFGVVAAGVAPLVFHAFGLADVNLWRASAMFVFLVGSISTLDIGRRHIKMSRDDKIEVGIFHSVVTWGLNFIATGLLIAVVVGFGGWAFYVLVVAIILAITIINFVTITLQRLL